MTLLVKTVTVFRISAIPITADPGFSEVVAGLIIQVSAMGTMQATNNTAMTVLKIRSERSFASSRPIIVPNRLQHTADRIVRDGSMMANGSTCGRIAGPEEICAVMMLTRKNRPFGLISRNSEAAKNDSGLA